VIDGRRLGSKHGTASAKQLSNYVYQNATEAKNSDAKISDKKIKINIIF